MSTNTYESAVIINAALEDDQVELVISRIKENILNNGGNIREMENWGRKRLAYVIKKSRIGYYVIFRFDAPPNIVSKLERVYSLDEHILRFLTIKLSADAIEHLEKNKKSFPEESDKISSIPVDEDEISDKE